MDYQYGSKLTRHFTAQTEWHSGFLDEATMVFCVGLHEAHILIHNNPILLTCTHLHDPSCIMDRQSDSIDTKGKCMENRSKWKMISCIQLKFY